VEHTIFRRPASCGISNLWLVRILEVLVIYIQDLYGESRFRTGKRRRYIDLLKGRFAIKKVIRIERKDDPDAISQKWADYSTGSINKLFAQGINDTLSTINNLKLN
jgi:hypothetical protein